MTKRKRTSIRSFFILFLIPGILHFSCSSPLVESTFSPEGECWSIGDTIESRLTIDSIPYRIEFPMEFTEDYSYSNLLLTMEIHQSDKTIKKVPLEFTLMDPSGTWYSKTNNPYKPILNIDAINGLGSKGKSKIRLYHNHQNDLLCGVLKTGLKVIKLNPE